MNSMILRKAGNQLKHCDVKGAKVVAVACTYNGMPLFAVSNRRSKGRVSKWTKHAEERALERIERFGGEEDKGINLFVMRFHADGSLAIAKPCPGCEKLLKNSNLWEVWYTNERGDFERL